MLHRKHNGIALAILLFMPAMASPAATQLVKVRGERVNLRASPSLQAEVVAQVKEGDYLIARSFKENWVEVVPDEKTDFWIHKDFLRNNEVTASKLNVRAGAGINYSVVAELAQGDKVQLRGEFGEWVKIAPPLGASLWISSEFVDLVEQEKRERPSPPPVQTQRATRAPPPPRVESPAEPVPMTKPEQPAAATRAAASAKTSAAGAKSGAKGGDVLVPLPGQGQLVQVEGELHRVGFLFRRPAEYRLVQTTGSTAGTVCYVRGNIQQLESFLGQRMLIRGKQYWIQGAKYPVVVPEQIVPQ